MRIRQAGSRASKSEESTRSTCFFASDLHGRTGLYQLLFDRMVDESPEAVFLGGDLLPSGTGRLASLDFDHRDFVNDFLGRRLEGLRSDLGAGYPRVFVILGNDDARAEEPAIMELGARGLLDYVHNRSTGFMGYSVYGYCFIPPTGFMLKDWEKYDVSRYVDPGCTHPWEGGRSVPVPDYEARYSTIRDDLERLVPEGDLGSSIFLFHSPPYETSLDRAALDGRMIDHVPLDVHVGSIAIARFIRKRQPLITLHGHVHESAAITGSWHEMMGATHMMSAAHSGPELAYQSWLTSCGAPRPSGLAGLLTAPILAPKEVLASMSASVTTCTSRRGPERSPVLR